MDEKITIPENTRVIIEDGVIIFERNDLKQFNKGEWYSAKEYVLLQLECGVVGFARGEWYESSIGIPHSIGYVKADMKEVEKLLIKEAEKRGFKKGCKFLDACDKDSQEAWHNPYFNNHGELICGKGSGLLFYPKTGKWAEIIEEKKPLYTNDYGREYFGGETYKYVNSSMSIRNGNGVFDEYNFNDDKTLRVDFIGTEQECHRYLYENWNKIKE